MELSSDEVEKVRATLDEWRSGSFAAMPGFSADVTADVLRQNGANLAVRRHVRFAADEAISGEEAAEHVAELRARQEVAVAEMETALSDMRARLADGESASSGEWGRKPLNSLLREAPRTGVRAHPSEKHSPSSVEGGGEIPWVSTSDVSASSGFIGAAPHSTVPRSARVPTVQRGDLLLVTRGIGSEGKLGCAVVLVEEPTAYSDSLMRLAVRPDVMLPEFLRHFLISRQGRAALAAASTGGTIPNLRTSAVAQIEVPTPPLEVQRDLVDRLEAVERAMASMANAQQQSALVLDAMRSEITSGTFA